MEHADPHLAHETLPVVAEIAAELGAEIVNRSLAQLAARLLCFVLTELPRQESRLKETRLYRILEEVEKACTWPEVKQASDLSTLKALAESRNKSQTVFSLPTWHSTTQLKNRVRTSLKSFASSPVQISALLNEIENDVLGNAELLNEPFKAGMEEVPEYPARVYKELHDVLRFQIASCPTPLLMRLRLDPRDSYEERAAVSFEVLFSTPTNAGSSLEATKWQETRVLAPIKSQKRRRITFADDDANLLPKEKSVTILPGQLHAKLDSSADTLLYFRVETPNLEQIGREEALARRVRPEASIPLSQAFTMYKMSKKMRCNLAYTLAKSVWQYYDSEWMKCPWNRENIHLLPDEPAESGSICSFQRFRPYLSPDFQNDQRSLSEFIEETSTFHHYPKVLALGILLIEIAREQPLEVPNVPLDYSTGDSINQYLLLAWRTLNYEGLFGKEEGLDLYSRAVKSCLDSTLFAEVPSTDWERESSEGLRTRREIIYFQIVYPLKKLRELASWEAEALDMKILSPRQHFDSTAKESTNKRVATPETSSAQTSQSSGVEAALGELQNRASLLSTKSRMTSAYWIEELVTISESFSASGSTVPIRVAVLDTGCNLEASIFDRPEQEDRLRGHWKDWVEDSSGPLDKHGHGTEIVSLLLLVLPKADIFVARVAKNEDDLDASGELIAKAIEHAALEWEADIITMSFGFPREIRQIKKAIVEVEQKRDWAVVLFAAAANEGLNTEELFPANLDSVISIRGTSSAGAFIPAYDPDVLRSSRGSQLYGTLGEEVPWAWPDETKLSSGCSIATPIAAAIAALIMQIVLSRPDTFGMEERRKIRMKKGIMEVFHDIATERDRNRHYLAPRKLVSGKGKPPLALIEAALDRLT